MSYVDEGGSEGFSDSSTLPKNWAAVDRLDISGFNKDFADDKPPLGTLSAIIIGAGLFV